MELIFLLLSSLHEPENYMLFQWMIGLILSSAVISLVLCRYLSVLCATLFLYQSTWAVIAMMSRTKGYLGAPGPSRTLLCLMAAISHVSIFTTLFSLLFVKFRHLTKMVHALSYFGGVNSLYVIIGCVFGFGRFQAGVGYSGLLDYAGMNGCLIALCMLVSAAHAIKGPKNMLHTIIFFLGVLALWLSASSIPYGVLACCFVGYLLCERKFQPLHLAGAMFIPIAIGFGYDGVTLFDSAGRFTAYKVFMSDWWERGHVMFGMGPGSFAALAPSIQTKHNFMINADGGMWAWYWLHSDWLQSFFELGVVGGILIISVYLQSLFKLYRSNESQVFAIACGLGGCALVNYPMKYYVTAFLFGLVVVYANRLEPSENY